MEDLSGALQPVYCNTTVQIVLGSYQWTEQDVLQLAAADVSYSMHRPGLVPMSVCRVHKTLHHVSVYITKTIILNHAAELLRSPI